MKINLKGASNYRHKSHTTSLLVFYRLARPSFPMEKGCYRQELAWFYYKTLDVLITRIAQGSCDWLTGQEEVSLDYRGLLLAPTKGEHFAEKPQSGMALKDNRLWKFCFDGREGLRYRFSLIHTQQSGLPSWLRH